MSSHRRNLLSAVLVTMFMLGTTLTVAVPSALAQTTYVSVINPDTGDGNFIYNTTYPPPAEGILVNVAVIEVEMLAGWQVNLTWDVELLQIADSADVYAPADHVFDGLNPQFPAKKINNAVGFAMWGCAVGPAAPVTNFNGSGRLMCVNFTVIKTPSEGETLSCELSLDRAGVFATSVVDPDGEYIDFTEQDGYYEYEWPPAPPQEYTLTIYSYPTGITFTVDGVNETTPWSGIYVENTSLSLVMPENYTVGNITYTWDHWSDGVTNRSRVVSVNTNITLTAYYTGGLIGDVDGDGDVDVRDLVLFVRAFGSYPTHRRWNAMADFNGDDKVNLVDLCLLMMNFGKHIP